MTRSAVPDPRTWVMGGHDGARALGSPVKLDGLSKTYVDRRLGPVQAIEVIDADIHEGEFVAVIGPSGCGKTTLLNLIAGLTPPSTGAVWLGDRKLTGPAADIGMVFQSPVLLPWRSARANVMLPIEMLGWARSPYEERAQQLLQLVGLGEFRDHRPYQLSGGMQQRVALCRALIHNPSLLLMDEPFSALDELTKETLDIHLLRLWSESPKTVVFVTHNVEEAVFLSDRVIVLSERPAKIVDVVEIPLSRPRSIEMRYSTELITIAAEVRHSLRS